MFSRLLEIIRLKLNELVIYSMPTINKDRSSRDQLHQTCKQGCFYLSQQCFRGVNSSIKYCATSEA